MDNRISIRIISYDGADRVNVLLGTMRTCWKDFKDITIIEDPCPRPENTAKLAETAKYFGVKHFILPKWGDVQGAAQAAFQSVPDDSSWVFILADDIVVTKDTLADIDRWISILPEKVAGIHPISLDFCSTFNQERDGFYDRFDDWYSPDIRFKGKVDCEVTYLLAGTAFAIKKSVLEQLGGFNQDWYGYDHDISRKIWLSTDYIIARCITAPIIHLGGSAQASRDHYMEVIRDSIDRIYTSEQKVWANEKFIMRKNQWNSKLAGLKI